jgi:hypothetical protein
MVIPTDCPICRDAGMIDFHPYIAVLCFQQVVKGQSDFDVFASF